MTPFAAWSKARRGGAIKEEKPPPPDPVLSDLLDDLVDNIAAANAVTIGGELQAAAELWAGVEAAKIAGRMRDRVLQFEQRMCAAVSDALTPLLAEAMAKRVVTEFAATLRKLLPEFGDGSIAIAAPGELHDYLRSALESQDVEAEIIATDDGALRASAGATRVEADLSDWLEDLRKQLAA